MSGSNTLGATIRLEGEKEYRDAITKINSSLKVMASEMNKVTAEFSKNDKSTAALTAQSKILSSQIEAQKGKVATLRGALEESSQKYGENDKKTNTWRTSLNRAEAELVKMENSLKDVNFQMEKSKTPLDKLNTELAEQGEKLKSLQTQYKNVVLEQGKNSTEAKSLATQIKSLNSDIKDNKDKLNAAEKATAQLGNEMDSTKASTSKLSEEFTVMKGVIANLAADAIKMLGRNLVSAVKSISSSGIEFESAFAGVKKTVDATDEEFEQFEASLRSMSTQMPTTASELSAIAEAAGQFGIKNENLISFTETMANLGEWFGMLPDLINYALALAIAYVIQWGADLWDFASTKIPEFIGQVVTFFSELPGQIWNWLVDAANKVGTFFANLISTGISKASEFVSPTVSFISALPGQIWNAIVGAVANVVSWGAQLLAAGINAAQGLVSGIWDTISQLPGKMLDIGRNLVEGLWNGISNATSWGLDKICGFGDSIMSGIKSFFGIASPSKLFENEIGKNLALGLGEGFTDSMKNVSKQMQNSIPTEFCVEPTLAIASGAGFQGAQLNSQSHTQPGISVHIENFVNNRAQDVQAFAQELEFYSRRSNFVYG